MILDVHASANPFELPKIEIMPVRTKRWNDPNESDDGLRILITRYRPRGLPKSEETWDQWWPNLGPSKELLAAFKGKGRDKLPWSSYRAQYLREMRSQGEAIDELVQRIARGETITLLCASTCLDERRCHRSLLRELIEVRSNS
jgi:uncharacterized protein YeaO (DUF488 family)